MRQMPIQNDPCTMEKKGIDRARCSLHGAIFIAVHSKYMTKRRFFGEWLPTHILHWPYYARKNAYDAMKDKEDKLTHHRIFKNLENAYFGKSISNTTSIQYTKTHFA